MCFLGENTDDGTLDSVEKWTGSNWLNFQRLPYAVEDHCLAVSPDDIIAVIGGEVNDHSIPTAIIYDARFGRLQI